MDEMQTTHRGGWCLGMLLLGSMVCSGQASAVAPSRLSPQQRSLCALSTRASTESERGGDSPGIKSKYDQMIRVAMRDQGEFSGWVGWVSVSRQANKPVVLIRFQFACGDVFAGQWELESLAPNARQYKRVAREYPAAVISADAPMLLHATPGPFLAKVDGHLFAAGTISEVTGMPTGTQSFVGSQGQKTPADYRSPSLLATFTSILPYTRPSLKRRGSN